MTYIMVDVESDGPIPSEFSMVSFGAMVVSPSMDKSFFATLKPISERFLPEALAVSGYTREQTLSFEDPKIVMEKFAEWIGRVTKDRPIFISDNNGYDWMFVCWYFHKFLGKNPFGFSSQNLGSLYKGLVKDSKKNFKHLRKTKHTHHPLDDVKGNVEAMLAMKERMGLNIPLG